MPRKGATGGTKVATKTQSAKKQKAIEDKTFGMKNKKGKTAQKQIQGMHAAGKSKQDRMKEEQNLQRKNEKKEKKKEEAELAALFKPAQKPQKCPPGVDPKSVLCIYFKSGKCEFGAKCKFSHDLETERKSEKRNIYSTEEKQGDSMDLWDDDKLAQVVNSKAIGKPHNPTAGICNHFLKALEERKYGWFWECPNSDKCPYRHALPPGFVLKAPKTDKKEEVDETPLEDILEEQRSKLKGGTPINDDTFKSWREKILKEKEEEERNDRDRRNADMKAGKIRKTGREILSESIMSGDLDFEGEAVDLSKLLKAKNEEEDAIDLENIKAVEQMQKAAEALAADIVIDEEEESKLLPPESESSVKVTTTTTKPPSEDEKTPDGEKEKVLEGIDTSLFTEDVEDLPEEEV